MNTTDINSAELKNHIEFVEKQSSVYCYHAHPEAPKMQSLLSFLKKLEDKKEEKPKVKVQTTPKVEVQSTLFDTNAYTKPKTLYDLD